MPVEVDDVLPQAVTQFRHALEGLVPETEPLEPREPPLHGVQPRRARRREVERVVRVGLHPGPDFRGLVRRAVVEDDVDVRVLPPGGHPPVHEVHERDELLRPVPLPGHPDGHAGLDVERGVEVGRPMPDIVVGVALDLPGPQLQHRLGVVEGLYLGFLVDRQHDRALRGPQVEADDVDGLFREGGVVADVERRGEVRAELRGLPYLPDEVRRQAGVLRHETRGPVRGLARDGVHRQVQNFPRLLGGYLPGLPAPRQVHEPADTVLQEAVPPPVDDLRGASAIPRDLVAAFPVHQGEDHGGPFGERTGNRPLAEQSLDLAPLPRRVLERFLLCCHASMIPHLSIWVNTNLAGH